MTKTSLSNIRAIVRIVLFLALTGILLVPALVFRLFGPTVPRFLKAAWFKGCCSILGLKANVRGRLTAARPTLFVANHVSYLDILVLGALHDVTFVAKSEVSGWPVFGFLARVAGTKFVVRNPKHAKEQKQDLSDTIDGGENLMLFPEGTSTEGLEVLPFKSSLFAITQGKEMNVQALSISYQPLGDETAGPEAYCWYGDMTLPPHLWQVFQRPGAEVTVVAHETLWAPEYDRKALAARSHKASRYGVLEGMPCPNHGLEAAE